MMECTSNSRLVNIKKGLIKVGRDSLSGKKSEKLKLLFIRQNDFYHIVPVLVIFACINSKLAMLRNNTRKMIFTIM